MAELAALGRQCKYGEINRRIGIGDVFGGKGIAIDNPVRFDIAEMTGAVT